MKIPNTEFHIILNNKTPCNQKMLKIFRIDQLTNYYSSITRKTCVVWRHKIQIKSNKTTHNSPQLCTNKCTIQIQYHSPHIISTIRYFIRRSFVSISCFSSPHLHAKQMNKQNNNIINYTSGSNAAQAIYSHIN